MTILILFAALWKIFGGFCCLQTPKSISAPPVDSHARIAISQILESSFQRAARKNPDGTVNSINLALLYVTEDERKRVRALGNVAIGALREFTTDKETWRQRMALQLLNEFRTDEALAALTDFADHSQVRDIAVSSMAIYPAVKTRTILNRFLTDPDDRVRDAAKRALAVNGEK